MTDADALRRYADSADAEAFAALVGGHVDLVYGAALRQVGDPGLAEDVAQAVFILLARKAGRVAPERLAGWLVRAAHYASRDALKRERRRRFHEEQAMRQQSAADEDSPWDELRPYLDAALLRLRPRDRTAIALRFLEGRSAAEVGETLGISEAAAAKRIARALERLRGRLARPATALSAVAVGAMLTRHGLAKAPASLPGKILAAPSGAAGAIAAGAARLMALAKAPALAAMIAAAGLLAAGVAVVTGQTSPAPPPAVAATAPRPAPGALRGTVVDESGRPVPNAAFTLYRTETFFQTRESSGRTAADGTFPLPAETSSPLPTEHLIVIDVPGHALAWSDLTPRPASLIGGPQPLRISLHPAAVVAGTVKNQDGAPVAGAAVELQIEEPAYGRLFLNADVGVSPVTDAAGNFRIDRIPDDARCHLAVNAAGYAPYFTEFHYRGYSPPIAAGTTDVDVALVPGATLITQVTRGGKPVGTANVPVILYSSVSGSIGQRARTGSQGEARFPVPPGAYIAYVEIRADQPVILPSPKADLTVGEERVVALETGDPLRTITGTVTAGGAPSGNVAVIARLTSDPPFEVAATATTASGRFTLHAPPGRYTLGASGYKAGRLQMYTLDVDATAADVKAAALAVDLDGIWRSQLVDENHHPLQGFLTASGQPMHTDAAGNVQMPPARQAGARLILAALSDDGTRALGISLAPGERLPESLELPRAASFTGKVLGADGQPPPRPVVVTIGVPIASRLDINGNEIATWRGAGQRWKVIPETDGSFRFPVVPSGWDIYLDIRDADRGLDGGVHVGFVQPGETRDVGTIQWQLPGIVGTGESQLPGNATVTGTIVDTAGKPVVGVWLRYGNSTSGGTSDLKGRFTLGHLPEATDIPIEGRLHADSGTMSTYWRISTAKTPLALTWDPATASRPAPRAGPGVSRPPAELP